MNEIQAEENPLSQDFTIKPLLKFACISGSLSWTFPYWREAARMV